MLSNELKDRFNNILQKYEKDDPNVMVLQKFLDSYDGQNESLFTLLFLGYINLMNYNLELKIKARGYDDLLKIKQNYDREMEDIKSEFEKIEGEESKILLALDDPDAEEQPNVQVAQENTTSEVATQSNQTANQS